MCPPLFERHPEQGGDECAMSAVDGWASLKLRYRRATGLDRVLLPGFVIGRFSSRAIVLTENLRYLLNCYRSVHSEDIQLQIWSLCFTFMKEPVKNKESGGLIQRKRDKVFNFAFKVNPFSLTSPQMCLAEAV